MAEQCDALQPILNSDETEGSSIVHSKDGRIKRRLSFASERNSRTAEEPSTTCRLLSLQSVSDDSNSYRLSSEIDEERRRDSIKITLETNNGTDVKGVPLEEHSVPNTEEKENSSELSDIIQDKTETEETSGPDVRKDTNTEKQDAEVVRKAQEEGCVDVVFPGAVTQDGCYRFVSEILKCILYQRQQLPMTYDQLVYSQKKLQTSKQERGAVTRRPLHSADLDLRKCHQTLQELEELLQQLEVLFSLSRVPRVLLLMGGSLILPKEMYEVNMEALALAAGDQSLRASSCLRQLFRTLFVADLLSDNNPVRLMPTTVLALAHRECGIGWFRPKLQFKVPTRVKNKIINLSTEGHGAEGADWQDYVWFQAPTAIKGFTN
ncbi:MAD2L1-binding protein [Xiphophorus couchianus]|uniref:MAD2L1-binding protein n=1 Tax=Xiphophorus couchianus TaxID=32473 RepID=UPI0010161A53|nr:MAD2L1-binding protein [Xiphophorus couchianus]XP_032409750.1 MAD2L1-binding protein [Xiphophorus hellerii]